MNAFKAAIQSGLDEYLQQLHRALDGLSPVELRWQPTLHTNPIIWLVWHMARVEDRWINRALQDRAEVWTAQGWDARFGMDPTSTGNGQSIEDVRAMPALPLTDLLAYFDAVRVMTHQYLDQATDADLTRAYPHPRMGSRTGTWIVGHLLVEISQHVGQVALIRGLIRGLEG